MKKKVILMCFMVISSYAYTQIGINTASPQGVFHVDGAKDNPTTGVPNTAQQANDFTVSNSGNVGIGTTTPSAKLEVIGKLKVTDGSQATNKVLTSDANGLATWQNLSGMWVGLLRNGKAAANPQQLDFTAGAIIGTGGSADPATDAITVPLAGLYEITLNVWSNGYVTNYLTVWSIRKNGAELLPVLPHYASPIANIGTSTSVTVYADLNANDAITLFLSNLYGGNASQANYTSMVVKLLK